MKLYGKNPVIERLKVNPRSIKKIFVQQGLSDAGYIRRKAQKWNIPFHTVLKTKLMKLAHSANTQGVLVEIEEFPYLPYDELLNKALKKKISLLFLDGLNDPQNLGAIIRSVACLGGFALILPTHKSVDVTEAVLRVASGGDNYVQIAKVSNLAQAIKTAKEAGFFVVGSIVDQGEDIGETKKLSFPIALVVGSEQKGIREGVQRQLDLAVTIPMSQQRLSLNVAHATALLCYEINKQKKHKGKEAKRK